MAHKYFFKVGLQNSADFYFVGRVAHRKFTHHPDLANAIFFYVTGNVVDFSGIYGFDLPAPVIDGTGNGKIVGASAEKFGIDSGPAGNNHGHRREVILYNGVGGQGGAQDNTLDFCRVEVFGYRL